MRYLAAALLLLSVGFVPAEASAAKRTRARTAAAKCVGATPCRACSNCKYCKHCAKDRGKCGVCRGRKEAKGSWEAAAEKAAHQH